MAKRKKTVSTRTKVSNRRRKGRLAVILPWLRRFGLKMGVALFILWAGTWLHMSGSFAKAGLWAKQSMITASGEMGFVVDDILLEGRVYSDIDFVRAVINIQKGDPLFAFNPAQARTLLERMEWVRHAHVERRLPDKIYIRLSERVPMALWQKDQVLHLLDDRGEEIKTDHLSRFSDLMIVIGEEAPQKARYLITALQDEPSIFARVEAASWVGNRRWDLRMKSGMKVKLPEEDIAVALRRLYNAQEEDGLLDKKLAAIDLRASDKIILKTKPGGIQEYKAGLKADTMSKAGSNI